MDFMKMIADWRLVVARSVLVCHVACAAVGLATMLGVIAAPYMLETAPSGAALATAAVTGLLCMLALCALGGGVRYAVYGDFKLLPGRSFRDYFPGRTTPTPQHMSRRRFPSAPGAQATTK